MSAARVAVDYEVCGRAEWLCPDGWTDEELAARPTCPACARRWDKLRAPPQATPDKDKETDR